MEKNTVDNLLEKLNIKKKHTVTSADVYLVEENDIKKTIINLLKKKGTHVSMAPLSKLYIITNDLIDFNILIDGSAELIKATEKDTKYGWKFRESFINNMIDLAIAWIEKDRAIKIKKIFESEMSILVHFNEVINTLDDRTPIVENNL